MTASVVHALAGVARDAAHLAAPRQHCRACGRDEAVLADRADTAVVRHGSAVAKAHADDTEPAPHRARLAVAGHPLLAGILLPPLLTVPGELHGRPVSAWPYGMPVDPDDPDAAPWEDAGTLCARLHTVPAGSLPGPLPAMRGPAKAAAAFARMRALGHRPEAVPVRAAWEGLPPWARGEAPSPGPDALCHGDLHLGQLVRHPATPGGDWLLIDVDDLGLGDPTWDLARPAAWFAAGLLTPETWQRFLDAYRAAGGPAVPAEGDPWPQLDVAARALTVQSAALALVRCAREDRRPDEVEQLMIEACARIASHLPELGPGAPT